MSMNHFQGSIGSLILHDNGVSTPSSVCWWPPQSSGSRRAARDRHRHGGASCSPICPEVDPSTTCPTLRLPWRRSRRQCLSTIWVVLVWSTLMAWQINPGSKPTSTHLAQASHCWLSRSACWFKPSLRRFVYWPRELVGTHRYLRKESGIARAANGWGLHQFGYAVKAYALSGHRSSSISLLVMPTTFR